ncbi:MAG TPA: PDDEXK nuclease domain-containing protein [Opitutaceae bacterium]|nr:PDDEXK nuclease domain-containing protein [Opitutaceae bacterium]
MNGKKPDEPGYGVLVASLERLLDAARRSSARAVNAVMTATYWEVGRRIVEFEQGGEKRAGYGERLIARLAQDLTGRLGRGFGAANLTQMRRFYLTWPLPAIPQTPSGESAAPILQTVSEKSVSAPAAGRPAGRFPLPWSHYVRLMSVKDPSARQFYEAEALRAGWSFRQLSRQVESMFYERTALSRNKAAMLEKAAKPKPGERAGVEDQIKDPYLLEFLDLKDEYSEHDLEEALLRHLESFLLELGSDFAFVGRQRRLRIGDTWFRVDLLLFHRRLRCLVIVDLKIGRFTHADAGQMHTYLNYARQHWTNEGENPPVGLILCSEPDDALAQYSLEGLPNKILAREYRLALPAERKLASEIDKTRQLLESRRKA